MEEKDYKLHEIVDLETAINEPDKTRENQIVPSA